MCWRKRVRKRVRLSDCAYESDRCMAAGEQGASVPCHLTALSHMGVEGEACEQLSLVHI